MEGETEVGPRISFVVHGNTDGEERGKTVPGKTNEHEESQTRCWRAKIEAQLPELPPLSSVKGVRNNLVRELGAAAKPRREKGGREKGVGERKGRRKKARGKDRGK